MYIHDNSIVTVANCTFHDHFASSGGALYLSDSKLDLLESMLRNNFAVISGGAVYYENAVTTTTDSSFLENLAFADGGAMYINAGTGSVSNTAFTSNVAAHNSSGGGIYATSASFVVSGCAFTSNEAENHGGGMYVNDATSVATVGIYSTDFDSNEAKENGGGLYAEAATISMDSCNFASNSAKGNGGGLCTFYGTLVANNLVMKLNQAENGGAVSIIAAILIMSSSNLYQNTAVELGGALFSPYGYSQVVTTTFTSNYATYGGGIMAVESSYLVVSYCTFTGHITPNYGGAVVSFTGVTSSISDSTFTSNFALAGCAIFSGSDTMSISRCTITSHSAYIHGGAVYVHYSTYFGIADSTFSSNTANNNGGTLFADHGTISISNTDFTSSRSTTGHGGTFYFNGAIITLTNVDISDSRCALIGGAGYVSTESHLTILSSTLKHCVGLTGGALYTEFVTVIMNNVTMEHNIADGNTDGGAIYVYFTSCDITNTRFHNNTGRNGGALTIYTSSVETSIIKDTVFSNNFARLYGGAVYFTTGIVTFAGCSFLNNHAKSGGGIYSSGTGTIITMNSSNFTENVATYGGGGYYLKAGTINSEYLLFSNNEAKSSNFEVVLLNDTNANVNETYNNCSAYGGCIYSSNYPNNYNNNEQCLFKVINGDGTLAVTNFLTEINYDYLAINGYHYSGSNSPEGISVDKNNKIYWETNSSVNDQGFEICFEDGANGGGVYIAGGVNNMDHVVFRNNKAVQYGGAVYVSGGDAILNIIDLYDNYAELDGSEYYFDGGTFVAYGVSLLGDNENYQQDDLIGGSSMSSSECLSTCPAGQHGTCELISTSACYVNCECNNCTAGTFNSEDHSTVIDDCEECESGYFSSEKGTVVCEACPIGQFATNDITDYGGGLDVQTISGAITCNDCPQGYISDTEAKFVCSACGGGTSSKSGSWNCSECPIGTKSESGDASCSNCDAGKYGFLTGTQLCIPCDTSKTSSPGSSVCDQSDPFYYLPDGEVQDCPDGTVCLGGYNTPIPLEGYWMDISSSDYTDYAYRCPKDTCRGGVTNTSCFTLESMDSHPDDRDPLCNKDELMCRKGSFGPLCGACKNGYRYSTDDLRCNACADDTYTGYIIVFTLAFMIFVMALLKLLGYIDIPNLLWNSWPVLMGRHLFNSGSLKVLISAYQIIQSVTLSMEIVYPKVFAATLAWFSFLALDTPGLECNGFGVYGRVYFASLAPMALALFIFVIGQLRIWDVNRLQRNNKLSNSTAKQQIDHIKSQHAWLLLFLSYLVLPPVTGKQLKALDCFPFSNTDGARLLRIDTSIDCHSMEYELFMLFDILLILVYMSIPIKFIFFCAESSIHR
mmetsp:Transcript_30611/g.39462  ORF Transcript_30611/g.39462 Transcript_30611/m.39462 type:complete len:1348 (-) Transcript_30611:43-4086(-)